MNTTEIKKLVGNQFFSATFTKKAYRTINLNTLKEVKAQGKVIKC
jgi:hypothetical protein